MDPSELTRTRMLAEFKDILEFCSRHDPNETPMQREAKRITQIQVERWQRHLKSPLTWRRKIGKIREEYWGVRMWVVRPEDD